MLINANAQRAPLRDDSVHCVVTSPPYFGHRLYQAGIGEMGCEATPEAFVSNLVLAFREVWRVLRNDGVAVLNLGDSYAANRNYQFVDDKYKYKNVGNHMAAQVPLGLKPKDLIGIPWRGAFALQADGWYLRQAIPWIKTNGLPESVKDRPTTAHEYIFLLSKRKRYFWDGDAVRRKTQNCSMARQRRGVSSEHKNINGAPGQPPHTFNQPRDNDKTRKVKVSRSLRTSDFFNDSLDLLIAQQRAWLAHLEHIRDNGGLLMNADGDPLALKLATFSYKGAHFATFPPRLVEPFIKAGTSERGVCGECGAPWVRMVEKELVPNPGGGHKKALVSNFSPSSVFRIGMSNQSTTLGFRPTCDHDAPPVPATVLDPFCGSGTTLLVARQLGRRGVGLDLSYGYLRDQARERLGLDRWAAWLEGQPAVEDDMIELPMFNSCNESIVL